MEDRKNEVANLLKSLKESPEQIYMTDIGIMHPKKYEKENYSDEKFINENLEHIEYMLSVIPKFYEKTKRFSHKISAWHRVRDIADAMKTYSSSEEERPLATPGAFEIAMILLGFEYTKAISLANNNRSLAFKAKMKKDLFKKCHRCKRLRPNEDFEKMEVRTRRVCSECYEMENRKQHKNGWDSIPDETKNEINKYIEDGFTLSRIATKFNIPYPNLFYWKKKGFLKEPPKQITEEEYQQCINMVPYTDFAENMSPSELMAYCKKCGFI
jgi:hypothetical protein